MKLKHYMIQFKGIGMYGHVWAEDHKVNPELKWHEFYINSYLIAHFWQCDVVEVFEGETINFYVLSKETLRA